MSFYHRYSQLLVKRPILTNAITTAFLFGTGDVLAQKVSFSVGEPTKPKYDLARTFRAVVYGGIIFAPLADKWYKLLPRIKIPVKSQPGLVNTMARVFVDQCVFAPFIGIPLYYSAMTVMENHPDPLAKIKTKMLDNWWNTLRTNWYVWPAVQCLNFGFVPVQLRLLVVNVVSIGWNCYLLMVLNDNKEHSLEVTEEQIL